MSLFLNFLIRFYLFIHERYTERGRHIGRGRSRFPVGSLVGGLDPGTPGSYPELKAGAQPLSHPGVPLFCIFKHFFSFVCFNLSIFYSSSAILSFNVTNPLLNPFISYIFRLLNFLVLEFLLLNRFHTSGGILQHSHLSIFKSCYVTPLSESPMCLFYS